MWRRTDPPPLPMPLSLRRGDRLRFEATCRVPPGEVAPAPEELDRTAALLELPLRGDGDRRWLALTHPTAVYGAVVREVDERVEVEVAVGPDGSELRLVAVPRSLHRAHDVGCAGLLLMAAGLGLVLGGAAGWRTAVAIIAAGGMWSVWSRERALMRFEGRLRGIVHRWGRSLWSDRPLTILPRRRPFGS